MSGESTTRLEDVYRGWETYQQYLLEAIAPLTAEQLDLRAAPHLRSVGLLALHIIGARAGWFHNILHEGGPELEQLDQWDEEGAAPRSAAEVVHGLEATWQVIQECLARWTFSDLNISYSRENPWTGETHTFTRQWVIWHVIEHDIHHGGELFFTLGMHGLPTPDL